MPGTEILISVLVFAEVFLFGLGAYFYVDYRKKQKKVIERIRTGGGETPSGDEATHFHSAMSHWIRFLKSVGSWIKPKGEGEVSYYRRTLLKAGYRGENGLIILFGIRILLAALFFVAFALIRISVLKTMPSLHFMFLSILIALIGFYLPNLWLQLRIAERKKKIQQGLPDALDLMVVCVEAGTGLDAAIQRVGEEMKLNHKIVSEEFKFLGLELRAGKQRQDALRNLVLRTDLDEVSSLVTLLIQTERFGTSIGQALRVHSDSMRTRRYQRAEEVANKIPVKLIFPLLFFIFPALFVVILGPAFITIFRTFLPTMGAR